MPHVRVQRFGASYRKHDRSEEHEPGRTVVGEEPKAKPWIQRRQNLRCEHDLAYSQYADGSEPDHHHGSEYPANFRRALVLVEEEHQEDRDGYRNDETLGRRRDDFQTFDGAQHRYRRGYHAVAVKQRGTDEAERD